MSKEELLKPRYKVIADWPFNTHSIGEIIVDPPKDYYYEGNPTSKSWPLSSLPHLFKKLEWWHERKPDDLPKFIGSKNQDGVFNWVHPVVKWEGIRINEPGECVISFTNIHGEYEERGVSPFSLTPATEQEYNEYLKSKS